MAHVEVTPVQVPMGTGCVMIELFTIKAVSKVLGGLRRRCETRGLCAVWKAVKNG
jgi:hypothetical protein